MLSLVHSPLGFSSLPVHKGHTEDNPCHDMIAKSALNTVVGNTTANAMHGKVVNLPCFEDNTDISAVGPQSGADVTAGAVTGQIDSSQMKLIDGDLKDAGLCSVNVHWHEGAEHRSENEYDENGEGPNLGYEGYHGPLAGGADSYAGRRLAGGSGQTQGHHCHHGRSAGAPCAAAPPAQSAEGDQEPPGM